MYDWKNSERLNDAAVMAVSRQGDREEEGARDRRGEWWNGARMEGKVGLVDTNRLHTRTPAMGR